jgi:hypothetical protein
MKEINLSTDHENCRHQGIRLHLDNGSSEHYHQVPGVKRHPQHIAFLRKRKKRFIPQDETALRTKRAETVWFLIADQPLMKCPEPPSVSPCNAASFHVEETP